MSYGWNKKYNKWERIGSDRTSIATPTIDYSHYEIHGGAHYFVANYARVNSGSSLRFGVTTPLTGGNAHIFWQVQSTGETLAQIYEGATFSSGTNVSAINSNRNSTKASFLKITYDDTITNVGTIISQMSFGLATTPSKALGGEIMREDEIILNTNTAYLLRITSLNNDNLITYKANWYEHENEGDYNV